MRTAESMSVGKQSQNPDILCNQKFWTCPGKRGRMVTLVKSVSLLTSIIFPRCIERSISSSFSFMSFSSLSWVSVSLIDSFSWVCLSLRSNSVGKKCVRCITVYQDNYTNLHKNTLSFFFLSSCQGKTSIKVILAWCTNITKKTILKNIEKCKNKITKQKVLTKLLN